MGLKNVKPQVTIISFQLRWVTCHQVKPHITCNSYSLPAPHTFLCPRLLIIFLSLAFFFLFLSVLFSTFFFPFSAFLFYIVSFSLFPCSYFSPFPHFFFLPFSSNFYLLYIFFYFTSPIILVLFLTFLYSFTCLSFFAHILPISFFFFIFSLPL